MRWGLELRTEENEVKGGGGGGVGHGLDEEGFDAVFHGDLQALDFIEREPFLGLGNGFFAIERAEFPIDDDDASLRQVFEVSDDTVPKLTRSGLLDLQRFHAFDSKFNRGPLG